MSKVRVAICTDGIYPHAMGGMQKHSRLLIDCLARHKELHILVIHPHPHRVFNNPDINEIPVDPIDPSKNYLLECYKYSRRVYSELVKFQPHVVYSQGLSVWYRINELSNKLIVNPHGLEPFQAVGVRNKLMAIPFKIIFTHIFRRCAAVISLGGKLTALLQKVIPKTQLIEIPNAVSLPTVSIPARTFSKPLRVLFLARFAHNKGIDILFKAFQILQSKGLLSKYRFTLAGTGPLYAHFQKINNYSEVTLSGFVKDDEISSIYTAHDLFLFPTLFEGMPTAVLEAMSYGLPVIVSDVGATAVLVNELNGRLIRGGSATDVVDALEWFYELPLERKIQLSENSRKRVASSFTWDVISQQHVNVFLNIHALTGLRNAKNENTVSLH